VFFELYSELESKRSGWANEEELRLGWIMALTKALGIDFHAERGRRDSSYNNVVIEFKDRGLFRGKDSSPSFKEAIYKRLEPYILKTSAAEGIDPSDYIGIAIDGDHVCFAQVIDRKVHHGPLLPFSQASVAMVATACQDSFRRAVTAENLIEDFGHESTCGLGLMKALAEALADSINQGKNNKTKMLFEEWRTLYGQVADLSSEQIRSISGTIRFRVGVDQHLAIPASLFVIHTYNSLMIKLLAAEIVSTHGLTSYRDFAQRSATLDDEKLLVAMTEEIEQGRLFSRAGINGFVEEAIFSWYLDVCGEEHHKAPILAALRDVFIKLSLYRTDHLTVARSNDVLKRFYQNLVPDVLRKSLGEFYTPDWLVEFTMDKVEPADWLHLRTLDPTCGSGSFLLEVMRRKRKAAELLEWSSEKILSHLTSSVWGFDLNPLAVQSARVNFLIAIADLLKAAPGEQLELPILLADAIYSPARDPEDGEDIVKYRIGSSAADLEITLPSDLAFHRDRLDRVFEIMGSCVESDKEYEEAEQELVRKRAIDAKEASVWKAPLQMTYDKVLRLHRKDWNGIWFRIVRNFFWSATAGKFDVIAGNPPWVRWSKLPDLYRERVKPTCQQYKIFSSTPHHGGNELDISGIITYSVADKWLNNNGKLAFVITQTHFQSPSSEGFRDFRINNVDNLIPLSVDDMKAVKPFPDAANKTAVALFKKSQDERPNYPVPYHVWNVKPGQKRAIPVSLAKDDVMASIEAQEMEATPVSGNGSPWAILPLGRFKYVQGLSGRCTWVQGRKGITADLNGIYFVEILEINKKRGLVKISTRPEAGRNDIGPRQEFWVEPNILYPLIKGASDFSACQLKREHALYVLVPNKGIVKDAYEEAAQTVEVNSPMLMRYFDAYEANLRTRSTFRGRMKNAPFYAIYNVGGYTFAPWKVIWGEQKDFCAAVVSDHDVPLVGSRPFVPDHKIFFVDFQEAEPAYFLCGILNSNLAKEFVDSHNISIQIGDIFKHMNLPSYDPIDKDHGQLVRLAKQAHDETDLEKREGILNKLRELGDRILED
jgi:hypothetical protein